MCVGRVLSFVVLGFEKFQYTNVKRLVYVHNLSFERVNLKILLLAWNSYHFW